MKNYIFLIFFSHSFLFSQIDKDSISYNYFYKNEIQKILALKKQFTTASSASSQQLQKIAELYRNINIEDSAYANYYKAYEKEQAKRMLSDEEYNQLLYDIHYVESSKNYYHKDRRFFLNQLYALSKEEKSDKWRAYCYLEFAKDHLVDSLQFPEAEKEFEKIFQTRYYQEQEVFQAKTLLAYGYLKNQEKKYKEATEVFQKSLYLSGKIADVQNQFYNYLNLAVNDVDQSKYSEALEYLDKAEVLPIPKYKVKSYRLLYFKRKEIYSKLGDSTQFRKSELIFTKLDSLLDDFRKNSNFYEIDSKFQLKEKQRELTSLEGKFNKNRLIYSILLFFVFLLAFYSFLRWKKVDARKREILQEKTTIEHQHTTTVQELEKVKQLVIEDHITLKNKAKVYLNELMYIKSEDHYLQLVTTGKNQFVRGKLSEIIEQLPPNFTKCHRSYIINKNFISQINKTSVIMTDKTEIPFSRNFKL
ncbi:LytTR family transcriptional regulator DNA-binding domain-containing protein [Flavobacterium sp. U410]